MINPEKLDDFCSVCRKWGVTRFRSADVMIEFGVEEEPKTELTLSGLGKSDPIPTEDDFLMYSTGEPLSYEKNRPIEEDDGN